MKKCTPITDLKIRMLDAHRKFLIIQKRIKTQLVTRFAKVEVLCQYWDKVIG